jgi:tripartite-type tricarboxylate transporter receptor subunit TctC
MQHARGHHTPRRGHLAALSVALLTTAACAESGDGTGTAADCFEGERLSFVVAYGEGGLYDAFARQAAPFLEEELGATVVVENQPGAGGLTAANSIYTAEPDGLTVGFFSGQGLAGAVLGGSAGVQFDLADYTYVARLAQDSRLLVTAADAGVTDVDALLDGSGLTFASAGPGGADHIDATVLIPVLDLDMEIVTGYEGSADTALAVTSGDTDLASGTVPSRRSSIESGEHAPVLVIGEERSDALPDVPALLELDLDDEQRSLAEAHTSLQAVGVDVLGPPDMPEECTTRLTDAFEATLADEAFVADMEALYQPVDFTAGDELREDMMSVLDAPEEYRELLRSAYAGQ